MVVALIFTGCVDNEIYQDNVQSGMPEIDISNEQNVNVWDVKEEMEDIEEDMIKVSVLGKETLLIEKDRIHDDVYGLDQLNNRWTLEETDAILNSIKGTWEVDEYVGYISYSLYCNGRLTEEINSEEEQVYRELIWEQFENAKENSMVNVPKFQFSIKERNGEDIENNYIYVNSLYSSPVSIILSMNRSDDGYPVFIDRTTIGLDFVVEYPVIYIKFFTYAVEEEQGKNVIRTKEVYEPATLILTSDGQFLLLIDGAFYSLKRVEETFLNE